MIDVSVVIPVRNMADTLEFAIESALRAGCDDVIVVDDHSTDLEYAYNFDGEPPNGFEQFQDITWIKAGAWQRGVVLARNIGISRSKYDLIVPLDADDELLPDALVNLVAAWEPGTLVYGHWTEAMPAGPDGSSGSVLRFAPPPALLNRKNIAHATWLFHANDWLKVGGYDPDFNVGGEDWAFMVALVAAGVKVVQIKTPILKRAVRSGSRTDQARSHSTFIKQLLKEKYPAVMEG